MGLGASLVTQALKYPPVTGDSSSIPGSGRSPGEGNGYPLRYSCLENLMDRGAWRATVHGVSENQTGQSHCLHSTVELSRWGGWKGNLHSFSSFYLNLFFKKELTFLYIHVYVCVVF